MREPSGRTGAAGRISGTGRGRTIPVGGVALLISIICLVTAAAASTCRAQAPYPPDIKRIKDRGELIVAQCSSNQPGFYSFAEEGAAVDGPFHLFNGRRLIGFDVVLAMRIARALGVDLRFDRSACDFDTVCLIVAKGEADLAISKVSATLERAQYVRFSRPYALLGVGLLVNRVLEAQTGGRVPLMELCNRPGTKIGVWEGTSSESYAREMFPYAHIKPYASFDAVVQAVIDKDVFACVDEDLSLTLKLREQPKMALWVRFLRIPDREDRIAVAVAPDCPNLLAFVNLFLESNEVLVDAQKLLERPAMKKSGLSPNRKASTETPGRTTFP